MIKKIGIWDVLLDDDGSLDTVLIVQMRLQPHIQESIRYGQEWAGQYRNKQGYLTEEGFAELARDAVDAVELMRF